jgi:hypothetical protein
MAKKVLIVILLIGFAWAYPPTRARMALYAQPVLERMGPVGDRMVLPIQRYNTRTEINFILDQIHLAKTEAKEIPDERTFHRWMSKRILTKNNGKDPWNHPYYLIRVSGMFTVGSVGPDGQRGTGDDLRKSVQF